MGLKYKGGLKQTGGSLREGDDMQVMGKKKIAASIAQDAYKKRNKGLRHA